MILLEKQRRRIVVERLGACIACMLVIFVSLFALPGCGATSKDAQAKQDEQGKQTNEAAMNRMIQEQGRPGAMPGAGGAGMPTPGGTGTTGMPAPGGK